MSEQEENLQAIAETRRLLERFLRADWPRARCPVCGLGTIVIRGVLVRHEARGQNFICRGSGTVPGPQPEKPRGPGDVGERPDDRD